MDEARRRRTIRIGLLALGVPQLAVGLWALVSPRGWFDTFPGPVGNWLPEYGPYDEHLVRDVGSTFTAIGLLLVLAAVWLDRRAVQAALIGYLVYQLPHTIYHLGADDRLSTGDQILNSGGLALGALTALALLPLAGRQGPKATPAARPVAEAGRLSAPPRSLMARVVRSQMRRQYGGELKPVDGYLHHPRLLMGYGGFERAVEAADKVDTRVKYLAETKAAAVVGCEWCMDFASHLSRAEGISDEQLRELPRYRESAAFDDLEKLVLDYATAMSRTPVEVDDALFARLREHFDDAQVVELTNAIAIENLRARFNQALGFESQDWSDGAFCVVPEREAATA